MRVLLVVHRYPPESVTGVETYTQRLARHLVQAGDRVTVVARRWTPWPSEPRPVRERLPDGVTLIRFDGGGEAQLTRFLNHDQRLEQLFRAVVVETEPEVVHLNHLLGLSPRFISAAYCLRTAVVLSLHDFFFACPLLHLQKHSGELCAGPDAGRECARTCFADEAGNPGLRWGLRALYFRRLLALADRLVAGSRYVASYFEKFVSGPARVRVIPNGVPANEIEPSPKARLTPRDRGVLNLAYWGTVVPHKGVHVILEALQGVDLGRVHLRVLGNLLPVQEVHDYVCRLHERAAHIPGLTLQVHGPFQRHQLPALVQDLDAVIVPSLVPEAGPQVPREALARGLPVLVSRLGALPETVLEGETGFTFDPNRPEELGILLRRLVVEPTLLGRLREGVRQTHIGTVAEHAEAIRAVYREAVDALLTNVAVRDADVAEVHVLHDALHRLGFGSPEPRANHRPMPLQVVR
jgi:glycosyltransferase involved in cell wall biosynthesis